MTLNKYIVCAYLEGVMQVMYSFHCATEDIAISNARLKWDRGNPGSPEPSFRIIPQDVLENMP